MAQAGSGAVAHRVCGPGPSGITESSRRKAIVVVVKRLVVFDLDGTLAASKSAIGEQMATSIERLLDVVRVAVISGGAWAQFDGQLLTHLRVGCCLDRLSLLPVCGTQFYEHRDGWVLRYSDDLSVGQKAEITRALNQVMVADPASPPRTWGTLIEDRGSQITYSALGQDAPLDAKAGFDPDRAKRMVMKAKLDSLLPQFSVRIGGTTSLDITRPGVDKAYGIRKLEEILAIGIEEMIFVGDSLFPGGNDEPAALAGVESIATSDPNETRRLIDVMLACSAGLGVAPPSPANRHR
jgi:HAD superfamily hydrolase (TIGR01484 family)